MPSPNTPPLRISAMFSRLLIIVLVLCVPLTVAVLAQKLTHTVPEPELPSEILEVRLSSAGRNFAQPEGAALQEVPRSYTPRSVKHINQNGQSAAQDARETGASDLSEETPEGE